jgi:hypothetical protein
MVNNISSANSIILSPNKQNTSSIDILLALSKLRQNIWFLGIPFFFLGITTKFFTAIQDGYVTITELTHLLVAFFFFLSWLCLRPKVKQVDDNLEPVIELQPGKNIERYENYMAETKNRMVQLQDYHLISQVYTLPIPYLCQIYHLLNLKHLESIHSFSLGNLKIVDVNHWQPTTNGGALKFQTRLDSSTNVLRMWRRPTVEVDLILHTPFTVELSIPAYNGKRIIVMFNVFPITQNKHKFFIDIYSDLQWHKPLLQLILHIASCLTLFEDLPYLQSLARRNKDRLISSERVSNHKNMWLFKRFVELYNSRKELGTSVEAKA